MSYLGSKFDIPLEFQMIWLILSDRLSSLVDTIFASISYNPYLGYHFKDGKQNKNCMMLSIVILLVETLKTGIMVSNMD